MTEVNIRRTIFFTGFPGFIGKRLVEKILVNQPESFIYLLVEPRFVSSANEALEKMGEKIINIASRTSVIAGDISKSNFGLEEVLYNELIQKVNTIFHLAAIYNLAVKKEISYLVNVQGTINILDFAEKCTSLERLNYFSTCYVAGRREGVIKEDDLTDAYGFKNYYEETKHYAEVEVRKRMQKIPTTIIRPGIVIGDSETGEIDKFDGPYYIFALLARLEKQGRIKKNFPFVRFGKNEVKFFLVPVNFLINAVEYISRQKEGIGRTFQVVDPNPLTFKEFYDLTADAFGLKRPKLRIPLWLIKPLIWFPWLLRKMKMIPEIFPYTGCDAIYDSTNTQGILKTSNITVPEIRKYFPVLVNFVRNHLDVKPVL
jgi:thioester reductase-like protein